MADLTADQLADFREDIGDTGTPPAFSDSQLQRLYTRMEGSYEKAVLLAFDQLLSNSVKFADYTQNESQEKKSQIFNNLMKMRALWDQTRVQSKQQVRIVGVKSVPPEWKDAPYNERRDSRTLRRIGTVDDDE